MHLSPGLLCFNIFSPTDGQSMPILRYFVETSNFLGFVWEEGLQETDLRNLISIIVESLKGLYVSLSSGIFC